METNPTLPRIFRFGPFEVNLITGELRKRGIRRALQEQPLKILNALLEHPGEIVTRETLCRRLWPQGTFVDFEHSLNAAVRRLRVTLEDEAETPRFIETVHRRGYRFLVWGEVPALPSPRFGTPAPRRIEYGRSAADKSPVPAPSRARLAVLPFVSFDAGSRTLHFSEGLTDETTTQIARLSPPHVGVIARTSAARLAADADAILAADYLLEGSIRSDGDRVRIIAKLIDSREETHLWVGTYDRVATDALTLQMEVAQEIARAVAAALSGLQPALFRGAAS
jgi:TolB-like protein